MIKTIIKILALVVLAVFCFGWSPNYSVTYVPVTVSSFNTLWDIADHFYDCNEFSKFKGMCFEEYLYNIKTDKKNIALTKNGRALQVGDIVYVPIYKVK